MSQETNTQFTEKVWNEFQEAIAEGHFDLAERIAGSTKYFGFSRLSQEMFTQIATAREDYEANQEPDDNTHSYGIDA